MMPVYMDSNPHQRNQVPYPLHPFPGSETFQPHFMVDPSKSPMMYESWPCSSNCSRYPVPYHGCCNHGNFPSYYTFRPPYPHYAPSPAFHQYPHYPSSPEPYPVYYAPPRYSNEQPRYEYDKDPHVDYHCCGCPNHLHNQKNERGVKIEEQENDAEKLKGDSVVPAQPRNFSYPIVWMSPEYVKSTDHGKHNDRVEVSDSDKVPCVSKPSQSSKPTEQHPRAWNGWFPIDINGLKSLMQGQREKQPQEQQNQDNMMQFPFPIVWVPNSDRKQGDGENRDKRKMITALDSSEQAPVNVEPYVSDAKVDKPQSNKDISQDKKTAEISRKTASQKCVPVEVKEAKSEGTESKGRDISVHDAKDIAKNTTGNIPKRKSSSPTKASKLPPVCLRVDPLPKKRNGNGSSRSPSPPKGQPEQTSTKASAAPTSTKAYTAPGSKEDPSVNTQNISGGLDNVEPGEKKRRDIPVIEGRSKENKAGETAGVSLAQDPLNSEDKTKASSEEVVGAEKEAFSVKAANPDEPTQCKEDKRMSDHEAAKLIQSAFRGFEVRKWEPLKKLKEIADLREQVNGIRNHIQSLESTSDGDKDDKLRLWIGEKIMSLLLRLDTIQGLHSTVRDARKALVRELVILQERLDSLTSKWAEEKKAKDLVIAESVGGHASGDKDEENTHANVENNTTQAMLPNLEHMIHMSSVPEQKLNANDFVEPNGMKEEVEVNERRGDNNLEDDKLKSLTNADNVDAICEPEKEIENSDGEKQSDLPVNLSLPDEVDKLKYSEEDQEVDLLKESPLGVIDEEPAMKCAKEDQEVDLLKELPLGVVDEEPVISKIDDHLPEAESNSRAKDEKENESTNNPELEVDNLKCTKEEVDLLKELPLEVIDEEPAISKIDDHLPGAESNSHAKDERENEFINNPEMEIEMVQEEVIGDKKFEEPLEVHSTVGKEEHNGKFQQHENDSGEVPADPSASSETGSVTTQDKQVLFEEKDVAEEPVGTEEKDDVPSESNAEPDFTKIGEDNKLIEESMKVKVPADLTASSESETGSEATQEKQVLFEEKKVEDQPVGTESNAEPDFTMIGEDNKLIEENKKLKEIMEKLMEAGKDQLSVISNLTERVKDLEEKLAKTKKSSKPGNRKLRYAPSYYKPVRAKRRVAEVAM